MRNKKRIKFRTRNIAFSFCTWMCLCNIEVKTCSGKLNLSGMQESLKAGDEDMVDD